MKTGGRLVQHARYYWLLLAEGHLNRKLFGQMLGRIRACRCRVGRTVGYRCEIMVLRDCGQRGVRQID